MHNFESTRNKAADWLRKWPEARGVMLRGIELHRQCFFDVPQLLLTFDKITLLNSRISIYRTNIYMLGVVSEAR
jgi:hypothetical protein